MPITPFSAGSFLASRNTSLLIDARAQLDELQRQLGSGEKAITYGGLGNDRVRTLDARAKLTELEGYEQTAEFAQIRLTSADTLLKRLGTIETEAGSAARYQSFLPDNLGATIPTTLARLNLSETIDALNEEVGGRYLFAGRASDTRPVVDIDTLLDGDGFPGGRDGLRRIIEERRSADLGAVQTIDAAGTQGYYGRLTTDPVAAVGTTANLAQQNAASDFGFQILDITSSSGQITTTGPAGALNAISATVAGVPADGDTVRIGLRLANGTRTEIVLTAKTEVQTASTDFQFEIDPLSNANTAANLRQALRNALSDKATSELQASSAHVATTAFFNATPADGITPAVYPPRVPGATAAAWETAVNFDPAVRTDTVIWYQGDLSTPARESAVARVSTDLTVPIGARANEDGFKKLLVNLAVVAVESFTTTERKRYVALTDLVKADLSKATGTQRVSNIQSELALSSITINDAQDRLKQKKSILEGVIADVEGVDQNAVSVQLLSVQTRLQASYQITSSLSQLSLVNYVS